MVMGSWKGPSADWGSRIRATISSMPGSPTWGSFSDCPSRSSRVRYSTQGSPASSQSIGGSGRGIVTGGLERPQRPQGHPLAGLALALDVDPHIALERVLQRPAAVLVLLVDHPLPGPPQARGP